MTVLPADFGLLHLFFCSASFNFNTITDKISQKKVKEVRLAILSECSFNEGRSGAEILAQIKLWVI